MTDTSENINIPEIGFGTYDLQGDDRQIVLGAINSGFRLIDTARVYGSEMGVDALAKICGQRLCSYLYQQYGADFITAIPINAYGIGDNFDP